MGAVLVRNGVEIVQRRRLDDEPQQGMQAIYWSIYPLGSSGEVATSLSAMHVPRPATVWEVFQLLGRLASL
jgi:hypothetical protein